VVAPRVVGETVGLHPLTVILGVLGWSIVFGGVTLAGSSAVGRPISR